MLRPRRAGRRCVGLDEAYLDLSQFERRAAARRVKAAINERAGLGCSMGSARQARGKGGLQRRQAGCGSSSSPPSRRANEYAQTRPGLVPAIGPKTAEQAATTASRRSAPSQQHLTTAHQESIRPPPSAPYLARPRPLEDERRIEPYQRVAKSDPRDQPLDHDLRGLEQLEPELRRLTEQLCETLERQRGTRPRHRRQGGIRRLLHRHPPPLPPCCRSTISKQCGKRQPTACSPPRPCPPVRLRGVRVAGLDHEEARRTTIS